MFRYSPQSVIRILNVDVFGDFDELLINEVSADLGAESITPAYTRSALVGYASPSTRSVASVLLRLREELYSALRPPCRAGGSSNRKENSTVSGNSARRFRSELLVFSCTIWGLDIYSVMRLRFGERRDFHIFFGFNVDSYYTIKVYP